MKDTTRAAWQDAYEGIKNGKEAIITINEEVLERDILSLRYFLPIARQLQKEGHIGPGRPLVLQFLGSNEPKDKSNITRAMRFFSNWKRMNYIRIQWNDDTLPSEDWTHSSIFPCCAVGEDYAKHSVLKATPYNPQTKRNDESKNSFAAFANDLLEYIRNNSSYANTIGTPLYEPEKQKLRKNINDHINRHLQDMDVLSQIIWLYMLYLLIDAKAMIRYVGDDPVNMHGILVKTRMDAICYADGMYHAIENACIHSEQQRAWFGFRLHSASRDAIVSDHFKEARTRDLLSKKFTACYNHRKPLENIFGRNDTAFYLEFYVLDFAEKQNGIIDTYNNRVFQDTLPEVEPYFKKKDAPLPGKWTDTEQNEIWAEAREAVGSKKLRNYIHSLREIFDITPRGQEYLDAHIEDITVHYGLKMLRHTVRAGGGYMMGSTPMSNGHNLCYWNGYDSAKEEIEEKTYFTEWNVIFPVSKDWRYNDPTDKARGCGKDYFGTVLSAPPQKLLYLNDRFVFHDVHDSGDKQETILSIQHNLESGLYSTGSTEVFALIKLEEVKLDKIECFSKALFGAIARLHQNSISLKIALHFPGIILGQEFIRFFSAFYYNGFQADLEHTQIALCSPSTLYENIDVVNFMLIGSAASEMHECARHFVYHHAEDIAEQVSILKHLSLLAGATNQRSEATPVFPFDIYLPTNLDSPKDGIATVDLHCDSEKNWFRARIEKILNSDARYMEYGCKLNSTHIRLGSKVHLESFFQAELLFHNVGNVMRFAYIIAQDILFGGGRLNANQSVLLLGYEKYSSALMLQIEYYLRQSQQFVNVYTAVVHNDPKKDRVKLAPYFDKDYVIKHDVSTLQSVVVLPVATTLSTVYKVYNTAKRELRSILFRDIPCDMQDDQSRVSADKYYCVVLVNDDLTASNGGSSDMTKRFWNEINRTKQMVTVSAEEKNMSSRQLPKVKYFIPANGKWLDPSDCPACKARGAMIKPIIGVKHAGTLPGAIFPLYRDQYNIHPFQPTPSRLGALLGNIKYSHVASENNHFQFYIDFQKLYNENKVSIDESLRALPLDRDAFHVVVSPLQMTNSAFVQSVVDNAFEGAARFIHFDIMDTYREETRARFSFLTEDFRRIKKDNPHAKFRIHFADSSIVTGTILNRAKTLLQMLLDQSEIDHSDVTIFDHVFLMVNRCHPDTVATFVRNPHTDLYAYIQVKIPSYNTAHDFCPACKVRDKYKLMAKRCSTRDLRQEFKRLEMKHEKRTAAEYDEWEEESILHNHTYFLWLMQWLHVIVPEDPNATELHSMVPSEMSIRNEKLGNKGGEKLKIAQEIKRSLEAHWTNYIKSIPKPDAGSEDSYRRWKTTYAQWLGQQTLSLVEKDANKRKILLDFVREELISVRAYMRLSAMQTAYVTLESVSVDDREKTRDNLRKTIVNMIADGMRVPPLSLNRLNRDKSYEGKRQKERYRVAYGSEWLISYIKVLSRQQIGNYYDYRQAVAGIMSDIFNIMSLIIAQKHANVRSRETRLLFARKSLEAENDSWKKIIDFLEGLSSDPSEPLLCAQYRYQIYMTLFHRMADMEIIVEADSDCVYQMLLLYDDVDNLFDEKLHEFLKQKWTPFPKLDEIPFVEMPSFDRMLLRYLKAVKVATMSSSDANLCIKLTEAPKEILKKEHDSSDRVKDYLTRCARYLYLENTQLMYDGMRKLNMRVTPKIEKKLEGAYPPAYKYNEKTEQVIGSAVFGKLQQCYDNLDGDATAGNILYQNILANFCDFWHRSTDTAPVNAEKNAGRHLPLAHMLQFFRLLEDLSENNKKHDPDELPYLYEELCRAMCGVTGFKMCYLAYVDEGKYPEIFAQSGYYADYFNRQRILNAKAAEEIIAESKQEMSHDHNHGEPLPGISIRTEKNGNDYLVLSIPVGENKSTFYIILQSDSSEKLLQPAPTDCESESGSMFYALPLRKARDILFMRQKLHEVLFRDYSLLMSLRFDCSYVRPMVFNSGATPVIMHISDLHVDSKMQIGNINSDIMKTTKKTIENTINANKNSVPDLLVVSGDLVDSRDSNAKIAQERYQDAGRLLNQIVMSMWCDEMGYLPHDWRRRVIICTGNHDFASMNLYSPTLHHRALSTGTPIKGESGTMAKFAYYVDFLIRYLDPPIHELLSNDLNELRFYRKLNTKVLVLNMSSAATTARTNKIGVNLEIIDALVNRTMWKNDSYTTTGALLPPAHRLCVGHYSPNYEPLYSLDSFKHLPGWEWDEHEAKTCAINELTQQFWSLMSKEVADRVDRYNHAAHKAGKGAEPDDTDYLNKLRIDFKNKLQEFNSALDTYESDGDEVLLNAFAKRVCKILNKVTPGYTSKDKLCAETREAELYKMMTTYIQWLEDDCPDHDEGIAEMMHSVSEALIMSDSDKKELSVLMEKITLSGDVDLFLAGHIHEFSDRKYSEEEDKHKSDDSGANASEAHHVQRILVSSKYYDDKKKKVYGYLIKDIGKSDPIKIQETNT